MGWVGLMCVCEEMEDVYSMSNPQQREDALRALNEAKHALENSPELKARAREELVKTVDKLRDDDWTVAETRAGFRLRILPPKNGGDKLVAGIEYSNGDVKEFQQTEEGRKLLCTELMRMEAGSRAREHIEVANELCEKMKEAAKINDHKTVTELGVDVIGELEAAKTAGKQSMPKIDLFNQFDTDEEEQYYPMQEFKYPNGGIRVLEAGMFKPQDRASQCLREERLLEKATHLEEDVCLRGCDSCGS